MTSQSEVAFNGPILDPRVGRLMDDPSPVFCSLHIPLCSTDSLQLSYAANSYWLFTSQHILILLLFVARHEWWRYL